jgi:hypothetical protein
MSARKISLIMGALLCSTSISPAYALPSQEEMWEMLQAQQKEIAELKARLEKTNQKVEKTSQKAVKAEQKAVQAEKKVDATSVQVEKAVANAGSVAPGWWQHTQLGGYGEMHYNGLKDGNDQIDFHRFVLFVGHDFTEDLRMFSELELEHSLSGEGEPGEVELEQAYIEMDLTESQQAKAGLFLVPVGILNETHEPPTFFGVERNPVETNIIPTTWWEGGVGFSGALAEGFGYDFAVHSGLSTPTTGASAFKIRNGRQKVANAEADSGAVTGRIKWTGMPGVELGASAQYQQDMAQNDFAEEVPATLVETHADIRRGPWGLRALYARWDLDANAAETLGRDIQHGWYVEPSYRFTTSIGEVGVFGRYNQWNNEAGLSSMDDSLQYDFGVNFWPHKQVVLKADFAIVDNSSGSGLSDDEILNLGVGFQF